MQFNFTPRNTPSTSFSTCIGFSLETGTLNFKGCIVFAFRRQAERIIRGARHRPLNLIWPSFYFLHEPSTLLTMTHRGKNMCVRYRWTMQVACRSWWYFPRPVPCPVAAPRVVLACQPLSCLRCVDGLVVSTWSLWGQLSSRGLRSPMLPIGCLQHQLFLHMSTFSCRSLSVFSTFWIRSPSRRI